MRPGSCAYDPDTKATYLRLSKKLLSEVVAAMGLKKSQYALRVNEAGIGSSGDVTLHTDPWHRTVTLPGGDEQERTDAIYVQINNDTMSRVLGRVCVGRRDYVGKRNQWLDPNYFQDPVQMAEMLKSLSPQ